MPGFDGTGPNGMGPMTGGGRGFCAAPVSGAGRPAGRRFFGYGRGFGGGGRGFGGRGRGFRNMYYATGLPGRAGWGGYYDPYYGSQELPAKDELSMLQEEADMLKKEMEEIQNRIMELESKEKK